MAIGTYKGYADEYAKTNLSAVEKRIAEQQKKNTAMSNQYIKDVNSIVDTNISNAVNKVQGEINKLPTQYQSGLDANAIQQKINERQIAERMANMGATDSGLNRTQQTAINIQRSNADAAIRQQMYSATASLKEQIANLYASGELQKAENQANAQYELNQKNQSVYDTGMSNFYSAQDAYAKSMVENDYNLEQQKVKAAAELQKAAQTQYNNNVTYLRSRGFDLNQDGSLVYIGGIKNENVQKTVDKASKIFDTAKTPKDAMEGVQDVLEKLYNYGYSYDEIKAITDSLWAAYGYKVEENAHKAVEDVSEKKNTRPSSPFDIFK